MKPFHSLARFGAILFVIGGAAFASAQFPATIAGPGSNDNLPWGIATDSAGNCYVTGQIADSGSIDFVTAKYDSSGNLLWQKTWDDSIHGIDIATAIALDSDSNVYVTGVCQTASTGDDVVTIKYNSNGVRQWLRQYNGPASKHDWANGIAVDGKGKVAVVGYVGNSSSGRDGLILAYDSAGTHLWTRIRHNAGNDTEYMKDKFTSGGDLYAGGTYQTVSSGRDFSMLKFQGSGTLTWSRHYNGPANGDDTFSALAIGSDNSLFVTGTGLGLSNYDQIVTIKYDQNGVHQWTAAFGSQGVTCKSSDIALNGKGECIVTGTHGTDVELMDYITVKYDGSGTKIWQRSYSASALTGGSDDEAKAIGVDSSDNIYVTGFTQGNGVDTFDYNYTTIKYDSAGNRIWLHTYDSATHGTDMATGIAVTPGGKVYVTGQSAPTLYYNIVTVKY